MKRVLLATTALFALSGVTVAAADVSISGNTRFHYDAWSDDKKDKDSGKNNNKFGGDLQLWVKGNTVADSGLKFSAEVRFRDQKDGVERRYITMSDDWGKITLGRNW